MQRASKLAAVAGVSLAASMAGGAGSVEAQSRYDGPYAGRGPGAGWVTAESHWGHGRVSGPVRQGRHGPEVRLPGGSWVHCVRSCSETLRRESIDFWESHGNHAKDPGPSYFHWEWRF